MFPESIRRRRRLGAALLTGVIAIGSLAACDPTDPSAGDPAAGSTAPSAAEQWVEDVAPALVGRPVVTAHWAAKAEQHGYEQTAHDLARSATGSAYTVDRMDEDLALLLDPDDRAEWTDRLRSGESTVDLLVDDLTEARASSEIDWSVIDHEDWLRIAYHLLLGIAPDDDPTGYGHHLASLTDGSTTRAEVATYLADTGTARTRTVRRIADELGVELTDTEAREIGEGHVDDRGIRAAVVMRLHPGPAADAPPCGAGRIEALRWAHSSVGAPAAGPSIADAAASGWSVSEARARWYASTSCGENEFACNDGTWLGGLYLMILGRDYDQMVEAGGIPDFDREVAEIEAVGRERVAVEAAATPEAQQYVADLMAQAGIWR